MDTGTVNKSGIRVIVKVEDDEDEEDEQLMECEFLPSSQSEDLKDPLQLPSSSFGGREIHDHHAPSKDGKPKSERQRNGQRKGVQKSKDDEKEVGPPAEKPFRTSERARMRMPRLSTRMMDKDNKNSNISSINKQVIKKEEVDDDDDAGWVQDDKDPDYLPDSASDKTQREENEKVPMRNKAKGRAGLSEADKKKRLQRENERRREKKAKETPAEKEERLRKDRISRQKLREKRLKTGTLVERKRFKELSEAQKEKDRQRKKLHRTNMTPEQKEEANRKNRERAKLIRAQMTPEERREIRRKTEINSFFSKEAQKATLTKEEWEQQEFQRKMHNYMQHVAYKAKFTPQEWKEKERRRRKKEYERLPEEKKEARREVTRKYFKNLPEEKRMEYQKGNMARMKLYYKKVKETNQDKWKGFMHKIKLYQRKQTAKETPEKRQKRLLRYKVYQAKRKAKLKMEEEGVPPEEIEMRLVEIVRQVEEKDRLERERKPVDTTEYKPREAARKPKTKKLHKLETPPEKEEQNDNSSHFSSTPPQQSNASLMEESSTQVKDIVVGESVTRDNPVATLSVVDSYSEPSSPSALDDDAECFSDFVKSPNSSFPTTVNLDNSEERKPNKKSVQQFETPSVSAELTEQPSPRQDSCSFTQANNVADEEESVFRDNPVAARSLIDSYSEPCSPAALAFQDDDDDDDCFSDSVPRPASSAPSPAKLDNSETNNAQEIECASGTVEPVRVEVPPRSEQIGSSPVEASEDVPTENKIMKEAEDHRRVMCDECGKYLSCPSSMRTHKQFLHNPSLKDFKCPKCENRYSTAHAFWDHYLNVHEETVANSTDNLKSLKMDKTRVPAEVEKAKKPRVYGRNGPFVCEECGRVYKEKANLNAHVRIAHQEQRFICDVCGKEEQSGGKLWRHKVAKHPEMDAPPPEGTVICEYCTEPILRRYPLHVKTAHPEKYEEYMEKRPVRVPPKKSTKKYYHLGKSKCTECNKEIGTCWMKRHMRNVHGHYQPKTFPCQQCGKKFKENYHLQYHIRIVHTFENFDRKVESMKLIREEVDEDGQRILLCSLCDEKLLLYMHMRAHLISSHLEVYEKVKKGEGVHVPDPDASPWQCGECSEDFSTELLFCSHVHSIHPETKYYCSQLSCHKLFKSQEVLRTHHSEEHPRAKFSNPLKYDGGTCRSPKFKCSHCKVEFRTKVQLLEHVKSLHPEKYWVCSHCESLCDNEQLLETHRLECRRNPERKRKLKAERNKKTAAKRKKERKHRICERKQRLESDRDDDDDVDSDEDDATYEPPEEMGTRRSSRIKERKTQKIVKLFKAKVKREKAHINNHKLDKEVRVLVVRLTAKEINFYSTRK